MLSEAKHLGWWGVTPPQMIRRYAPQHDIRDMAGVLTQALSVPVNRLDFPIDSAGPGR